MVRSHSGLVQHLGKVPRLTASESSNLSLTAQGLSLTNRKENELKKVYAFAVAFLMSLGLLGFGMVSASAAPAPTQVAAAVPAGNGTSNFYLTGSCNPWPAPGGFYMKFTNYDSNSGQIYHVSWTRSGVAYAPEGLYIDGVKYGSYSSDQYIYISGHNPHMVSQKSSLFGTVKTCSVYR